MKKIKYKYDNRNSFEAKYEEFSIWISRKSPNKYQWMVFTGSSLSDVIFPKKKKFCTLKEAKKQSELVAKYYWEKDNFIKGCCNEE